MKAKLVCAVIVKTIVGAKLVYILKSMCLEVDE
jgi:hypothetical protein